MPCWSDTCSRRAALAGAAALALTARAGLAQTATPVATALPEPTATPDPASTLVLRMQYHGGLMPAASTLVEMPIFSLYADGAIYGLGAQIAIYPPPALPALTRMRISAAGVTALVERARTIGLGTDHELLDRRIADAPLTVFTFVDAGVAHTTISNIVGLGASPDPLWPKEDVALLQALNDLAALLGSAGVSLPADQIVERETLPDPERLQVIAVPVAPGEEPLLGVPDVAQPVLAWPLSKPLGVFGEDAAPLTSIPGARCGEVSGVEGVILVAALRMANQQSPWASDGQLWGLLPRPLLPDETACDVPGWERLLDL
jgi:hypothetical protein